MTNPFIEPLTMLQPNGTVYQRLPHVQTQLVWVVGLPESLRIPELANLYSESVMYLFRRGRSGSEEFYDRVVREARSRIRREARRVAWRLPMPVIEDVCDDVELQIFKVIFAPTPDEGADFFEVLFAPGVESRTRNAMRSYQRSLTGGRRQFEHTAEEDEASEETIRPKRIVDVTASPEQALIARDVIEKVRDKVKPEYLEAAILFHCEDVPMFSKDPAEDTIARRLGLSKSNVQYRIDTVMKALRDIVLGGAN